MEGRTNLKHLAQRRRLESSTTAFDNTAKQASLVDGNRHTRIHAQLLVCRGVDHVMLANLGE